MNTARTGGCLCGAVRYECRGEPVHSAICHCRDCQKTSGSGFTPAMYFHASDVTLTGNARSYETTGGSGHKVRRFFCTTCGSQVFAKADALPDMIGVRAGTLDDPSSFHPTADIYTARAASWDFMDPDLPKFEEAPTA